MRRTTRFVTGIAVCALLGATLSACGPDSSPVVPESSTSTTATTSATSSSSTTSSATPSPTSKPAAAAVINFWAKLDELASNPTQPLSDLASVARDQALNQWQRNLTEMRGSEFKQVGSAVLGQPQVAPDESPDAFNVKVCVDVSKVNVVDKDGKSVVSPNRLSKAAYNYSVQKGNDGRFYVATDTMKGEPC